MARDDGAEQRAALEAAADDPHVYGFRGGRREPPRLWRSFPWRARRRSGRSDRAAVRLAPGVAVGVLADLGHALLRGAVLI